MTSTLLGAMSVVPIRPAQVEERLRICGPILGGLPLLGAPVGVIWWVVLGQGNEGQRYFVFGQELYSRKTVFFWARPIFAATSSVSASLICVWLKKNEIDLVGPG